MIKIGMLGDIGSGKTYVAKKFGYPVFIADHEVSKIYNKNKSFYFKLKKILPKFIKKFPVDKQKIVEAILHKQNNLKKISKIIHPIVRIEMKKFLLINKRKKVVVLDIPLLLENKLSDKKFVYIFVDAKKKQINKRLFKRRNFNKKIFSNFKKIQLPLEIKRRKAHFIIHNNFRTNTIRKNVNMIKKKILAK